MLGRVDGPLVGIPANPKSKSKQYLTEKHNQNQFEIKKHKKKSKSLSHVEYIEVM